MKIRGSKILVTGGCGLIGSTTIDLLLRDHDPAKIVIFDNLVRGSTANVEAALRDPRVELVQGDIRDIEQPQRSDTGHGCRDPHGHAAHHRLRRGAS